MTTAVIVLGMVAGLAILVMSAYAGMYRQLAENHGRLLADYKQALYIIGQKGFEDAESGESDG